MEHPDSCYFAVGVGQQSAAYWRGVLRRGGCRVDDAADPVYSDPMPVRERGRSIELSVLPQMQIWLRSAPVGSLVAVPHFGHFVSQTAWLEATSMMVRSKLQVKCLETGVILDMDRLENVARGRDMVKQQLAAARGRAMAEGRKALNRRGGRPKLGLAGARLVKALEMFVDLNWSVPAAAAEMGMSRATYLRRIEEARGTQSREVAIEMHSRGEWLPAPKRRGSNLKTA